MNFHFIYYLNLKLLYFLVLSCLVCIFVQTKKSHLHVLARTKCEPIIVVVVVVVIVSVSCVRDEER